MLTLCEAPTRETRPHHNTENSVPYFKRQGNAKDLGIRPHGLYSDTFFMAFYTALVDGLVLGSLINHNERDDDDVKYTRRDWDENVAFGGKMKLEQRGCSRTTTNEFLSDSLRI